MLESLKLRVTKLGISIGKPAPVMPVIPIEDEFAKAERERKAKEERDRIARQMAEEQRKARADAWRKINFKPFLAIGGIIIAMLVLFFIGNYILKNLPASPAPISTRTPPTIAPTSITQPTTHTPTITSLTYTPTPKLGDNIENTPTASPTLQEGSSLISYGEKFISTGSKMLGFYGTKGEVVTVVLQHLSGFGNYKVVTTLILRDSNGTELAKSSGKIFSTDPNLNLKNIALPETGTYYVIVNESPASWELHIEVVKP